ncbi:hypothetical protein OIO90_000322 [Microbotryomycetes sp. JL221]|nr:hypothetical protein OIO90_000322 [Microbotryomycetes sp. JL221]
MSASGSSVVSGLGITFDPTPLDDSTTRLNGVSAAWDEDYVVAGSIAQQFTHANNQGRRRRQLKHSMSCDVDLRGRRNNSDNLYQHWQHDMHHGQGAGVHPVVERHHSTIDQQEYYGAHGDYHSSKVDFLMPPQPPYGSHHYDHLTPLTELDPSSSDLSDRDYSPASLSSLPSSTTSHHVGQSVMSMTNFVNYDHQHQQQQPYFQLVPTPLDTLYPIVDNSHVTNQYSSNDHTDSLYNSRAWIPPPPLVNEDLYNGSIAFNDQVDDEPSYNDHSHQTNGTSRLPAFLQNKMNERRDRALKAKSMHELGRAYVESEQQLRPTQLATYVEEQGELEARYHIDDDTIDVSSPNESVPSSAGGLQRLHLQKQLEEQRRQFELEKRKLRHSTNNDQGTRTRSDLIMKETKRLARQRSRSMCATDKIPRILSKDDVTEPSSTDLTTSSNNSRRKSDGASRLRTKPSHESSPDEAYAADQSSQGGGSSIVVQTPISMASTTSTSLARHSTLLTASNNPVRRSKELDRLLAPTEKTRAAVANLPVIAASPDLSGFVESASCTGTTSQSSTSINKTRRKVSGISSSPVALEQAVSNGKARIEIDLLLENVLVVEGGQLKGKLNVKVKDKHGQVLVSRPKIRVVGFEELGSEDARHVFYQHATVLNSDEELRYCHGVEDVEGFRMAKAGESNVPFSVQLPVGKGAKGSWRSKQGVIRYIAIASIKLKSPLGYERSIAHFYRQIDVYPYYNPAVVLASASRPLVASEAKSLFMGGSGKVKITSKLHRSTWVAGQRCYVDLVVENESSKKIKSLTLALIRTTTILRPRPYTETSTVSAIADDSNVVHAQSTKKKVAEATLEMGKKGSKGVTAKGSWLGVESGDKAEFSHFLLVPSDELSIARGRHIEVSYAIKASVGSSLSADVSAEIPVRIVSFLSLDPPPGHVGDASSADPEAHPLARTWSREHLRTNDTGDNVRNPLGRRVNHMVSLDSLRLSDLHLGQHKISREPNLSRVTSMDSIRTDELSRTHTLKENRFEAPRRAPLPPLPRNEGIVGRALEKQLAHRMSLECISSAIASATARRRVQPDFNSLRPSPDLVPIQSRDQNRIQLDDLDDVPDDNMYYLPASQAPMGDDIPCIPIMEDSESEDELELDAMMQQSRFSDDDDDQEDDDDENGAERMQDNSSDEDEEDDASSSNQVLRTKLSQSFPQPPKNVVKTSIVDASPIKDVSKSTSTARRFSFATPTSPVKANVDVAPKPSPASRRTREGPGAPPPRSLARPASSSRASSAATSPTFSSPTKASVAREQATSTTKHHQYHELTKKPSGTSLKRSPGVIRRQSNKSLAEVAAQTESVLANDKSPVLSNIGGDRSSPVKPSPTISVIAPSPAKFSPQPSSSTRSIVSVQQSPRRVIKATSPTLRSARSMVELRSTTNRTRPSLPQPPPLPSTSSSRKSNVVLPSVQSKVAALEHRQNAFNKLSPNKKNNSSNNNNNMSIEFTTTMSTTSSGMKRVDSILSDTSQVTTNSNFEESTLKGFKLSELQRGNSVMSFKAPLLRRAV